MALISTMFDSYAQGIRPAISVGAEGGTTQDFTVGNPGVTQLFVKMPCGYQEASPRVANFYAQRGLLISNEVYFATDPAIMPNDLLVVTRVKTNDVIKLNVVGTSDPIQLGTTWVWKVPCERIRQPA
jgi:hypothetical protein